MRPLPTAVALLTWTLLAACSNPAPIGKAPSRPDATEHGSPSGSPQPPSPDRPKASWQRVTHLDVTMAIPPSWRAGRTCPGGRRRDFVDPHSDPCRGGPYVAFYGAALFDPAYRPGVRREGAAWVGYVSTDQSVVYVRAWDRGAADRILGSVHRAATGAQLSGG